MTTTLTVHDGTIDAIYEDVPVKRQVVKTPAEHREERRTMEAKRLSNYQKTTNRHTKTIVTEDVYESDISYINSDGMFSGLVKLFNNVCLMLLVAAFVYFLMAQGV